MGRGGVGPVKELLRDIPDVMQINQFKCYPANMCARNSILAHQVRIEDGMVLKYKYKIQDKIKNTLIFRILCESRVLILSQQ